jgi:hypothetical protein
MFNLRRSSYGALAFSKSDAASDDNLTVFEKTEKARGFSGFALSPSLRSQTPRRKLPSILKFLFLTSAFVFALIYGRSIGNYATLAYNALLQSGKAHGHLPCNQEANLNEPVSVAAPPWEARLLDRTGWVATCSTSEAGNVCSRAIDADGSETDWKSETKAPHWIIIDLKQEVNVHSLAMKPRKNWKDGGSARKHRVEVRTNKEDWELVALGTWRDFNGGKTVSF